MNNLFNIIGHTIKPTLVQNCASFRSLVSLDSGLLNVKSCLPSTSLVNEVQKRNKVIFKKEISGKRYLPNFKVRPEAHKYNYIPILPPDGEYTIRPLKMRKLGGRHPVTGKVVVHTVGGGVAKHVYWTDHHYHAPLNETIEEKVFKVRYAPKKTHLVALVGRLGHKRWIIASENMKPGDIIKTINVIPENPIYAKEGQMMPIGALSPGTLVHNVEQIPGEGGVFALAGGTSAEIIKRIGKHVVVRAPTGQEYGLNERCMACVGRVSNPLNYTVNVVCPQRALWKGKRPHLGAYIKKDGYHGRKFHPPKPLRLIDAAEKLPKKLESLTLNVV